MVRRLHEERGLSERAACRLVGQPRGTQRYVGRGPDAGSALRRRIGELSREYPRFGYRRVSALLRREGWEINRKRVHRIWKQEGLQIRGRPRKRRRLGHSENGCARHRPMHRNHVWTVDFAFTRTMRGRPIKILVVVDEWTRLCVAMHVGSSIVSGDVRETLRGAMESYGAPEHVRSDNGPEFIAKLLRRALGELGVQNLYIAPGSPWENGYGESFISKLKDELVYREQFGTVLEARVLVEQWRRYYNERRPHSSLGYRTPAEYATPSSGADSAPLRQLQSSNINEPCVSASGA